MSKLEQVLYIFNTFPFLEELKTQQKRDLSAYIVTCLAMQTLSRVAQQIITRS